LASWRAKRIAFVLAAVAGSVVLALAVAEVGLRIARHERSYVSALGSFHENDPVLGYRGRRGLERRFERPQFNVLVKHDAQGFRRVEDDATDPDPRPAILVFGDSVVWGWGVDQGKVLTDWLPRLVPHHRAVNLGICGAGTVMEETLFEHEVKERVREGDVVVLVFVWNDFFDNLNTARLHAEVRGGTFETVLPPAPMIARSDSPLDALLVLNALHTAWNVWRIRRATPSEPAEAAHLKATDTAALVARHYLEAFREGVEARKGRFVVGYFPGRHEVPDEGFDFAAGLEQDRAFRAAFESVARTAHVETLDFLPAFIEAKKARSGARLLIPGDGHPNEAGHEVMARALADRLH
jgi:lysophospholipase L1-like esterase